MSEHKKAILMLEDGICFDGISFGAEGESLGEVVFNTSMTGYQEIITDPSYSGQMVTLTYPQIGNYGIAAIDAESERPQVSALIIRELSPIASNHRCDEKLEDYLARHNVMGIAEIDTRSLVLHIRNQGAKRGILSSIDFDPDSLKAKVLQSPQMAGLDLASAVTCDSIYQYSESRRKSPISDLPTYKIAVYDFGIKRNILDMLVGQGFAVTVVPATTPASEVLALQPDGLFLSNGPGDPEPLTYAIDNIRQILGKVPLFGICLGHQLLALALGGKTYKLKFGHRGGNHPVRHNGRIEITAQNHGFAVDAQSIDTDKIEITHINLNDQTIEGLRHKTLPAFSVQYHPEASPGPHDAAYLFPRFREMIQAHKDSANA